MLDVIGAGFGRTGTMSLKAALERLGFGPCHHMLDMFQNSDEIPLWKQIAAGGAPDWDKVYGDYRATVDWPGARYWRELIAHYPHAKVILTVRDPKTWYDSARSSIFRAVETPDPGTDPTFSEMREMSLRLVWDGQFGGRFTDEEHALRVFDEHNKAVRREVPADRLLVFHISEGWEPLCGFLGVPVPDEPFPRTNDKEAFATMLRERSVDGVV
jgi:hypothetical protein